MSAEVLCEVRSEVLSLALAEVQRRAETRQVLRYVERSSQPQQMFHRAQEFGRIVKGANRSGKSTAGCVESLYWCGLMSQYDGKVRVSPFGRVLPPLPVRGRVVCPELPGTMDSNHVQRDKFREMCPSFLLRGGSWSKAYSVIGHTLWFQNGSFIEFKSREQELDKHAGESLHFVWYDEEQPRQIFYENQMRLDRDLGAWWLTYTPVLGLQWMYEELYVPAKRGEQYRLIEMTVEHNRRNLPPGFIEHREATLSPRDRAVKLRGEYAEAEGLVFDVFGEENIVDIGVVLPS